MEDAPRLCPFCAERLGIIDHEQGQCEICDGMCMDTSLVDGIDPTFEYHSFNVGVVLPKDVIERDEAFVREHQLAHARSIKTALNRALRARLSLRLNVPADTEDPDVLFEIDHVKGRVFYRIRPLVLCGRYRKEDRTIPQTRWWCTRCKGRGCDHCGHTGKMYPTSVEEIVSAPILRVTAGRKTKFHGAGREDIDVRMLGKGRPFVLEIINPKVRTLDVATLQEEINEDERVHVYDLRPCEKARIEELKNTKYRKTYRAYINKKLSNEEIEKIKKELETEIHQRTPIRVSHRRSDKIRKRKVYKVKGNNNKTTVLEIYCDGGLYIKELISGDEGRTNPSVSSILGTHVLCTALDVLEVHCDL